jgi:hypothetical protein
VDLSARVVDLSIEAVLPNRAQVLAHQGLPPDAVVPDHIVALHTEAADVFARTAAPKALWAEVTAQDFAGIYAGEGNNDAAGPVADIYPRADRLALFVATVGPATSEAIAAGFAANDFALASMLDAVASEAADCAAEALERLFLRALQVDGWHPPDGGVLRYSPGYCGWHVTGQRELFAALRPEAIGVTLTESCLMQPLKSVSGVLIAGPLSAHAFAPTYDVCATCETFTCRDRLRELRHRAPDQKRASA